MPYLIGRTGMAGEYPRHREYLYECIRSAGPAVQARAIRALGELKDDGVKQLCEAIALENWETARQQGLKVSANLQRPMT